MKSDRTKFPSYLNPFKDYVYVDPVYKQPSMRLTSKPKTKRNLNKYLSEHKKYEAVVPYKRCCDISTIPVRENIFKKISPTSLCSNELRPSICNIMGSGINFPLVPYVEPKLFDFSSLSVNYPFETECFSSECDEDEEQNCF